MSVSKNLFIGERARSASRKHVAPADFIERGDWPRLKSRVWLFVSVARIRARFGRWCAKKAARREQAVVNRRRVRHMIVTLKEGGVQ